MDLQASLLKKYLKMSSVGSVTCTIGSGMLRIPKIKTNSLQKVLLSESYDLQRFCPICPKETPLNPELAVNWHYFWQLPPILSTPLSLSMWFGWH